MVLLGVEHCLVGGEGVCVLRGLKCRDCFAEGLESFRDVDCRPRRCGCRA